MVSLRLTTTSMVEKPRLASCATEGAAVSCRGVEPRVTASTIAGSRVARQRHERSHDRDQPDLEQAAVPGREPGNGGLDEDRHDLYNVTHGSITGQSRRSQNVTAISNPA